MKKSFFNFREEISVSQLGLGLAVPLLSLIYGITVGKYNYKVIKATDLFGST
jgi:hypothetical protein